MINNKNLSLPSPPQHHPSPVTGHSQPPMAPRHYYNNYYNNFLYYLEDLAFPGVHLLFFVSVLLLVLGFSLYVAYESFLDDFASNLRLFFLASPILLLVLLHLLSSEDRNRVPYFLSIHEKDSFHRAGGSPWGVAVVLVLLLFMVSHRSALLERWFPLLARR